jgi:endonuclease/exonuclease/phosphatase (EEP) superfamily protein YafD
MLNVERTLPRREFLRCGLGLATGGVLLPGSPVPETIRIMTFNQHHGEGIDGVYDAQRIGRFIAEQKADLVGVQEVDRAYSQRSRSEDQPAILRSLLKFHSYYGPTVRDAYGNLLLSRYEISKARNLPLPNPDGTEPRKVIAASIPVAGHTLQVLNTHLSFSSPENKTAQCQKLREIARDLPEPVIITADYNTRPSQEFMPLLLEHGFVSTRLGLGFKEGIDDILISESWRERVLDGRIITTRLTDHPAFWIDLRVSE